MIPILWEPFGYPISSFGVMMALGFLAATSITAYRMKEVGIDPELATTMLLYCMFGGVVGAKLYYTVDEGLRSGTPWMDLLLSRAGFEAEDLDQAVRLMSKHPGVKVGPFEIRAAEDMTEVIRESEARRRSATKSS